MSAIHDDFSRRARETYPWLQPVVHPTTDSTSINVAVGVSRAEFDALKKEVEELKKLLKAAKEFDTATGQPDCEIEEKTEFLRKLAEFLGVDLDA